MKINRILVVAAFWLFAGAVHADLLGVVVSVVDGDTVIVLVDRKPVRVRLADIDAPEKAQAFGNRAKQILSSAVYQRSVVVQTSGTDRYGRMIGTIREGGRNINRLMVEQGMAWAYRKYLVDRSFLDVEASARSSRAGLWIDPNPVPPWEWRASKRDASDSE